MPVTEVSRPEVLAAGRRRGRVALLTESVLTRMDVVCNMITAMSDRISEKRHGSV